VQSPSHPQPQSVSSRTRFPIEHTVSHQPPPRALATPKATASSRVWSRPSRRQSSVRSPRPPAAPRPRVACRSGPSVRLVSGRPKRSCENEWPAAYRRVAMGEEEEMRSCVRSLNSSHHNLCDLHFFCHNLCDHTIRIQCDLGHSRFASFLSKNSSQL
jgi:hypothetical protein